jgi:hypothetical protein
MNYYEYENDNLNPYINEQMRITIPVVRRYLNKNVDMHLRGRRMVCNVLITKVDRAGNVEYVVDMYNKLYMRIVNVSDIIQISIAGGLCR